MRGLQNDAYPAVDGLQGVIRIISAVDADHAFFRFVEPAQQVNNGCLPAAGWADQGDHLARFHLERKICQDRFAVFVIEIDMVEFDLAQDRFGWYGFRTVLDLRRGVESG